MQELGISHYNRAGVLRLPRSIPHPISMVVWPHDRLIHLNDKRTSEKIYQVDTDLGRLKV